MFDAVADTARAEPDAVFAGVGDLAVAEDDVA